MLPPAVWRLNLWPRPRLSVERASLCCEGEATHSHLAALRPDKDAAQHSGFEKAGLWITNAISAGFSPGQCSNMKTQLTKGKGDWLHFHALTRIRTTPTSIADSVSLQVLEHQASESLFGSNLAGPSVHLMRLWLGDGDTPGTKASLGTDFGACTPNFDMSPGSGQPQAPINSLAE